MLISIVRLVPKEKESLNISRNIKEREGVIKGVVSQLDLKEKKEKRRKRKEGICFKVQF